MLSARLFFYSINPLSFSRSSISVPRTFFSAIFIASCFGISLTLPQQATIILTATLASIGTAGVPGAGMIMLAMVLEAIGIPVAYIGLIVAVDRLFDMGRTCLNVTGDIACSLCVTKWESKKK